MLVAAFLGTGENLEGPPKHSPRDGGMEGILLDHLVDAVATLLNKLSSDFVVTCHIGGCADRTEKSWYCS